MKLQRLIAAPVALGLTICSFPLLNSPARAKTVNILVPKAVVNTAFNAAFSPAHAAVYKANFYLAMDANEDSQNEEVSEEPNNEETSTETEVSEEPDNEETSTDTEIYEESPDTEQQNQNSEVEDNLEETEAVEESSEGCPEGKSPHPRFGTCISDWMNRSGEQDCIDANFGNLFSIYKCQNTPNQTNKKTRRKPDLMIKKVRFSKAKPRVLQVLVSNIGDTRAKANILKLTVRRIKGKNVRRKMQVIIPRLRKNQSKWIVVKAINILPKKARIKNTSFRLDVDASKVIQENNYKNNTYQHNR